MTSIDMKIGEVIGELKGIREDIAELKQGQDQMANRMAGFEGWKLRTAGFASGVAAAISLFFTFIVGR